MTDYSYLWLITVLCVLATFVWRLIGAIFAKSINTESALFQWVTCVSYAMVAALIARIYIFPGGALADTSMVARFLALAVGALFYFKVGKSLLLAIAASLTAFVALTTLPFLSQLMPF